MTSAPPIEKATARLPKKGESVELTIDSLAYGGNGVARHEGFVVFVQRAVPGQRVRAVIVKRRKGFAEARVEEVLQPSADAAAPKCEHFGVCGGCATQNYPYEKQLEQKQAQVEDLFARLGGFSGVEVRPIIGCEETYHYRNKMEFTFSTRPWLVDPEAVPAPSDGALGLHVPRRYDKVLDIRQCWLQHPVGNDILGMVRAKALELGLEFYDVKTHVGFLRHLVIRTAGAGQDDLEVMVNLVTAREDPERLQPLVKELVAAFPQVASVVNNINTRKAAVAYGEWEILLHGKPTIRERLRDLSFDISANSFFQTNTRQAEVLYQQLEAACGLTGGEVVYDLYCGTGTIALALTRLAAEVAGFEAVSSAVEDAARNALLNEITSARFFQADLSARYFTTHGKRLAGQVPPPEVIVTDPPRAGMHADLVAEILTLNPARVVYVSCNPATQVRDLRLLTEGGYGIVSAQPVDMFPHTPHVENICVLER
ncbi:MAG: 23S rRNA (uracil(1939)-C(5))-methyltransferase RlmD [Candidatus Neomarinimicrobiota bacterium]